MQVMTILAAKGKICSPQKLRDILQTIAKFSNNLAQMYVLRYK